RDRNVTGVQTCALPICLVRLRSELRRNGRIPRPLEVQRRWSEVALWLTWQRGVSKLARPSPPHAQHRGGTDRACVIERGIVGVRSEERRVGKGGGCWWG